MRRFIIAALVLAASVLVIAGAVAAPPSEPPGQEKKHGTVNVQLLTVSDWHGQLIPTIPGAPYAGVPTGGAAVLKAYFDVARAQNPNTLTFMAGDSFGAAPPISNFFDDEPAVIAQNMMGVTADTFGNHSFDKGIDYLQHLIDLADFGYVAANLKDLDDNLTGVERMRLYNVAGAKIAVIGIVNEEAPTLVAPGALGTIEITDGVAAANRAAEVARTAGANAVIVLTHNGIRGGAPGAEVGELIDFANQVDPDLVDVVVGDHTDFQYSGLHQGSVLAVENKSKGVTFAKIQLTVDRDAGVTGTPTVAFQQPIASAVTPDPTIQAYINGLNAQLAPILGVGLGESTKAIPRADQCGQSAGRTCESLVGDTLTDALRSTYGTDFALTNSGGLRAELTCPGAGGAGSGFCPSPITPPPYPITLGGVFGVLPFGNFSATVEVSGAELKTMLERGVSAMPGADGRFPQVSGLCFTYNIAAAAGSRVTGAVVGNADGSCTSTPVDLTSAASYMLATNDFTASGGDGYPNFTGRWTSLGVLLATDLADYIEASSPLSPVVRGFPNGRINCADTNGLTAPNCPTLTASP